MILDYRRFIFENSKWKFLSDILPKPYDDLHCKPYTHMLLVIMLSFVKLLWPLLDSCHAPLIKIHVHTKISVPALLLRVARNIFVPPLIRKILLSVMIFLSWKSFEKVLGYAKRNKARACARVFSIKKMWKDPIPKKYGQKRFHAKEAWTEKLEKIAQLFWKFFIRKESHN